MGLLTDPSAGQGKLSKALIRYYNQVCILFYIGGVAWFCALAYTPMNQGTYFSENALLPGLVKSEFLEDSSAKYFYEELINEMQMYGDSIPYPWFLEKFRQIGLDAYTHNFTLNYPLGKPKKFTGQNVYGIMRAARAASTESLVLSVPFRSLSTVHLPTAPSIAIMLAFAKFANRGKYWAKDIIFLVTEHEQLGVQAWLEAYHGVHCGSEGTLDHGDLMGRAGAIQAAINLELHDLNIGLIDIKIEGLNGQLPNLDLFNLAAKMCMKEGAQHTFKNRVTRSFRDTVENWNYSFKTLLSMVFTQATGVPNGNHGLFHRFGIQALTLEGFSSTRGATRSSLLIIGRILEGTFRSLNNLLERFHQSYFFYLLPSSERFISIGLYMPAVCLIAGALFIRGCAKWCILQQNKASEKKQSEENSEPEYFPTGDVSELPEEEDVLHYVMRERFEDEIERSRTFQSDDLSMIEVVSMFIFTHFLGVLVLNSPQVLSQIGNIFGIKTETSIYCGLILISITLLFSPLLVRFKGCEKSISVLNMITLLELGTALVCISMNNFSLALFCSVFYVPIVLFISQTKCRIHSFLQKFFWLLLHPAIVLSIVVLVYTFLSFPKDGTGINFYRSISATQQAIVFAIVDSMIYGNWLFSVICGILLPNWLCFWYICFSEVLKPQENVEASQEKKTN